MMSPNRMTYHNFIKIFMHYDVKNFDSEEFILWELSADTDFDIHHYVLG